MVCFLRVWLQVVELINCVGFSTSAGGRGLCVRSVLFCLSCFCVCVCALGIVCVVCVSECCVCVCTVVCLYLLCEYCNLHIRVE